MPARFLDTPAQTALVGLRASAYRVALLAGKGLLALAGALQLRGATASAAWRTTFLASGGLTGPAEINTGLKFVTKDNVAPYLSTSTRYEGKTDQQQIVPRSGAIKI